MRHLLTPDQRGITLMEILITLLVVGILAALGLPNMFAAISKNKVREGAGTVRNALQDAQRQAIRRGQQCTVQLGRETGSTSTYFNRLRATPVGCFTTGNMTTETISGITYSTLTLPTDIKLSTNMSGTNPSLQFSFKGNIASYSSLAATNQIPTIVVFAVSGSSDIPMVSSQYPKKCLMVSSLLGLLRSGEYMNVTAANSLAPANITSSNCNPSMEGRRS